VPDLDITDDGYLTVRIGGHEAEIDAFLSYNTIAAARAKCGKEPTAEESAEFHAAVVEHLMSHGFPRVSHAAAAKFNDALIDAVEAIRGNWPAGSKPGSPASTGSTPEESPPEDD
jgi:hypothetical protein